MTGDKYSHGEGDRRGHNGDGGTNGGLSPRDQQGTGHSPRSVGGANGRGTQRRKQACGAGSRDERRKLAGGVWGRRPGRKLSTPGEDLGIR